VGAKKSLLVVAAVGILALMFKVSMSMEEQNVREEAEAETELNRVTQILHKAAQDKWNAEHPAEAAPVGKRAAEAAAKARADNQRRSNN
jgi:hypothetical protein